MIHVSIKAKAFKGGAQVAAGQVLQQGLFLARNIVIARLLPPEQFGIALTFITIITALDSISDLGAEMYLIRSPDIADPRLQNTLQSILIMRSIVSALLIFVLADPIAWLFAAESAAWAYRALAVVPLIRGFTHLDTRRFERELLYWPGLVIKSLAAFAGLVSAIAAVLVLESYSAILISYIVQMAVQVIGSHMVAQRPYALGFDTRHRRELVAFAMPLLLNSTILFLLAQGDRLLVASAFGVRELADYGVAVVLSGGVAMLVIKTTGLVYLPILSGHKPGSAQFDRRYEICGAITASLAIVVGAGFWTLGPSAIQFIYGDKYHAVPLLAGMLGTQATFRIFRHWQQVGYLSAGTTKRLLLTNIVSAAGPALAAITIYFGSSIVIIAVCMAIGEVLAALASASAEPSSSPVIGPLRIRLFAITAVEMSVLCAAHVFGVFPEDPVAAGLLFAVAAAGGVAMILAAAPRARNYLFGG